MSRYTVPIGPRFVAVTAGVKPGRSGSSRVTSLTTEGAKDPAQIVQTVTQLHRRISELEANRPPEFIEFERDCKSSGTVSMTHNFKSPVRYSVVHWKGSSMPNLNVNEASTDTNTLVLNTTVQGRAIIRVERAQQSPTAGGFGT